MVGATGLERLRSPCWVPCMENFLSDVIASKRMAIIGTGREPRMQAKHVFLSYCHDNQAEVRELRNDLIGAGEAVWWDQDILPSLDWVAEIRKAMRSAYAVVLCLSQEATARKTAGIYPEVLDAVSLYRQYAPGSAFLFPVRLSQCAVPAIEIDATRTLDRIQYVDLFPLSERPKGVARLIQAIRLAPYHP